MLNEQAREPMAGEGPEPVASGISRLAQELAEPWAVPINGVGAFDQFTDPAPRKRRGEPDGGFFPDSNGNGGGNREDFRFLIWESKARPSLSKHGALPVCFGPESAASACRHSGMEIRDRRRDP
jgi:hypothetical protein